jgi:hypothetical protein
MSNPPLLLSVSTSKSPDSRKPVYVTLRVQDGAGVILSITMNANQWWNVCTGQVLPVENQVGR